MQSSLHMHVSPQTVAVYAYIYQSVLDILHVVIHPHSEGNRQQTQKKIIVLTYH